jgi:hypothetical protein
MREEELLLGISQLGAVFAGFVSIFLVFAKKDGRFSPADSLRVRSIIHSGFSVVFGALVPFIFWSYEFGERQIWLYSAIVFVFAGGLVSSDIARNMLAIKGDSRKDLRGGSTFAAWSLGVIAFVLAVSIIAGYAGAANYILALIAILAIAMINFVTIALRRLL